MVFLPSFAHKRRRLSPARVPSQGLFRPGFVQAWRRRCDSRLTALSGETGCRHRLQII